MKNNEEFTPYEKDFYSECNKIKFFCSSLTEIKFQIELLEKICNKELEIYEKQSSQILSFLNNFQTNILISHESEPSNLVEIISDLINSLVINFQYLRIGLIGCHETFKSNIPNICKDLEKFKDNILKKSIFILKESKNNSGNKENINIFINESFESVISNIFKGLVYIHQFFFLYSKAKNEFNINIKNDIENKGNNKIVNIIINDFSERKYAKSEGIYYEPIHFENNNNNILLKNESENIISLCDSYLYYGQIFIKCIYIRKTIISEFKKLINDIIKHSPNNLIETILHIKEKIVRAKDNFIIMGIGTQKSWDLLVQSWNYLYNNMKNFINFCNEITAGELLDDKKDEYKTFENDWDKLSKKIIDLRNKHTKTYTNEKKKQIKENPKEYKIYLDKEQQIKTFLNKDCYDLLNNNVPNIREKEKKRYTDIQELCYKFKKLIKINNEENIENSKIELENSTNIDIYQEVKDIFNKQNNKFQIKDFDNYMDNLKDKILSNIDFSQDNLAKNVKSSLDNYIQNNNEMNSDLEPSISDGGMNSLKEHQLEEEEKNINKIENENNNINNININIYNNANSDNINNNINNNDLNSVSSGLLNLNSNSLLKTKISNIEINDEISKNNNLSLSKKDSKNSNNVQPEKITPKLNSKNNNIILKNTIKEDSSFISVNEDEEEKNINKSNNKKEINEINNDKPNNNKIEVDLLNKYYNDPLIKKRIINRNQKIYDMLIDIHFFERLNKATKDRMKKLEKEIKNDTNFTKIEEFDKILMNKENCIIPPLSILFHYVFNPNTIFNEYPYFKSFLETCLLLRGDYNINILYDKSEIDKIPKYFNDFDYVNNLFNNYSKNDLDLFLRQIDTWYNSFSFELNYIHPIKKLKNVINNKINIKDKINIYFISPTDLIIDYNSYGSDFPFSEIYISNTQYRFHSDIKYNKNIGRFNFKASVFKSNKTTFLSENYLEEQLKIIEDENNKNQIQIYAWGPLNIVYQNGIKNNKIEADNIFVKHLKNSIFDYNYNDDNLKFGENSKMSDCESSNTSDDNDENDNLLKKKKINSDKMYYGILIILGLFSIKTLFGENKGFFSFDNFINILIIISIGFILVKSRE